MRFSVNFYIGITSLIFQVCGTKPLLPTLDHYVGWKFTPSKPFIEFHSSRIDKIQPKLGPNYKCFLLSSPQRSVNFETNTHVVSYPTHTLLCSQNLLVPAKAFLPIPQNFSTCHEALISTMSYAFSGSPRAKLFIFFSFIFSHTCPALNVSSEQFLSSLNSHYSSPNAISVDPITRSIRTFSCIFSTNVRKLGSRFYHVPVSHLFICIILLCMPLFSLLGRVQHPSTQ